ncbi:MAG: T9SS type A sorting domain-containing protein [Bacteroidia bacterium]|nr:T9SS type A sorting domain-containing protein [Bacteroidia bacterium]
MLFGIHKRIGFLQQRPGTIDYFVFDVLGRLRADGTAGYYREGEQVAHIQLPALPPGAYVLRLRGESAMAKRQFLVR